MIRINLLPFRAARKKENIRQQVSVFLLTLVFVLIGLGYWHVILQKEIKALKDKIEFTKNEVARYKKIAAEVEEIKKKLELLTKRLDVITQLDANRAFAFQTLYNLSDTIVEKRMWFISFETIEPKPAPKAAAQKGKGAPPPPSPADKAKEEKKEKPPVNVKIEGIALDEKTISDFMDKLKTSKFFSDVELLKMEQKGFKQEKGKTDVMLKGFRINCSIPPFKKEPEKADKKPEKADKKAEDKKDKGIK